MTMHPSIADRRRRVIRTRFELRREWIEDRVLPLMRFAQAAGADVLSPRGIGRTLWLESVKLEAAEATELALAGCGR